MKLRRKAEFLRTYKLSERSFRKTGLKWETLDAIYQDHARRAADLSAMGAYVAERLRQIPQVHSLKFRVKDGEHVVEKLVRKKCADPKLKVNERSYRDLITDLVGVRALHLFKDDWLEIHDLIVGSWDLAETPVANVRRGDPDDLSEMFKKKSRPKLGSHLENQLNVARVRSTFSR